MITKIALFGGALTAAGMANAQNFIYLDESSGGSSSFARSSAYPGALDQANRPDTLNTYSSAYGFTGTTTMSTTQTDTSMTARGEWAGDGYTGYGYGFSQIVQYFEVDEATDLLLEWDISQMPINASVAQFFVVGDTSFFNLNPNNDPLDSSVTFSVEPGVEYGFIGRVDGFISSTDTRFVRLSIVPTPGVASVLGIAGLAATRRRR